MGPVGYFGLAAGLMLLAPFIVFWAAKLGAYGYLSGRRRFYRRYPSEEHKNAKT